MTTQNIDIVTHGGKSYWLSDLAEYMDDGRREDVHSAAGTDTPQGFWDEFVTRYPDEADRLVRCVRPAGA